MKTRHILYTLFHRQQNVVPAASMSCHGHPRETFEAGDEKTKKPAQDAQAFLWKNTPAATYSPTQLPRQYHRRGRA